MAYTLKREHVANWDIPNGYNRLINDNDYDSPIPERSSLGSSDDDIPNREQSNQIITPDIVITPVKPHTLQYHYNKLPDNGIPLAVQYQEEKKRQKNIRKAPPGQGKLASIPESKSDQNTLKNFFPHQRYVKEKKPDLNYRTHTTDEGYVLPGDPIDPSKYLPEGSLSVLSYRPRERSRRKKKVPKVKNIRYNEEKKQYEYVEDPSRSTLDTPQSQGNVPSFKDRQKRHNKQNNDSTFLPSIYTNGRHGHRHDHHHRHHHHPHRHYHHHHQKQQQEHRHRPHEPLFPQAKPRPADNIPYSVKLEYEDCEFDVNSHLPKHKTDSIYFKHSDEHHLTPLHQVNYQNNNSPVMSHDDHGQSRPPYISFKRDWLSLMDDPKPFKSDSESKFYDRYLNNVIEKH